MSNCNEVTYYTLIICNTTNHTHLQQLYVIHSCKVDETYLTLLKQLFIYKKNKAQQPTTHICNSCM